MVEFDDLIRNKNINDEINKYDSLNADILYLIE
jgi:hypothetical protein